MFKLSFFTCFFSPSLLPSLLTISIARSSPVICGVHLNCRALFSWQWTFADWLWHHLALTGESFACDGAQVQGAGLGAGEVGKSGSAGSPNSSTTIQMTDLVPFVQRASPASWPMQRFKNTAFMNWHALELKAIWQGRDGPGTRSGSRHCPDHSPMRIICTDHLGTPHGGVGCWHSSSCLH